MIANRIQQMEQDRENLIRQTSELTVSLELARKEHARIQNSLRPISALPNELLSAIFNIGCHAYHSEHPSSNRSGPVPFEILISHVVHHWRAVALVSPHLWTNIVMDVRYTSQELALGYIQRSGAMPLNIRILFSGEDSFENLTDITRLVFPLVGRCNRLHCEFDSFHDMVDFFDNLPSSAPALRHLEIHYFGSDWDENVEPAYQRNVFVDGAPLLQSIHFLGITLHSCCPPLGGVTSFQYQAPFGYFHPTRASHTISGLTSLTHLVLSAVNFMDTEWHHNTTLALPSLTSLHLHSLWEYGVMLKVLVAPRLQSLYLGGTNDSAMHNASIMLIRSDSSARFPLLRSLTMQSSRKESISPSVWKQFAIALPRITHLTLLNGNGKYFLQFFSNTSQSTGAWVPWDSVEVLSLPMLYSVFEMRLVLAMKERRLAGYPVKVLKLPTSLVTGFKFEKVLEGVCEVIKYDPAIDTGYEVEWLDSYEYEDEVVESEDEEQTS